MLSHQATRLAECYKRGIHLASFEKNYDYAHAMFAECVAHDPGNLQFAEAMIQNLRVLKPHAKKSLLSLHRGGNRTLKKAQQSKDWTAVFRAGIELLKADPWDVTTLHAMADACAALHHNESELVYLKQALDSEPKNIEVNRHCARSLGRMGQFDQAIACWHRVETLKGKDEEALKNISILAEEKLRYPGGRPPTTQVKQVPIAVSEPEEKVAEDVVLSPRQKLEQAIANDRANPANYLELAAILIESNQWNAAESLLGRAISACGEQPALREKLSRVHFLRAEEQRQLSNERAARQQTDNTPIRIPWLEMALATALAFLVLQLVPRAGAAALKTMDYHRWSASGWLLLNVVVVLGLVALRYRSHIRLFFKQKHTRRKHRATRGTS